MPKSLTQADVINRANKIHNNKYDYSKFVYNGIFNKSIIICPKHGEFLQVVNTHINGGGCSKCKVDAIIKTKTISHDEFIKRANKKHKNKYDYKKTVYKKMHSKIIILCKEHGEFKQLPCNHLLQGKGCYRCVPNHKDSYENFIKKATDIHNGYYDYSNSNYISRHKKVTIICPKHGEFLQEAGSHLRGAGCHSCNISKGELKIKKYLERNEIKFIPQKTFDSCRSENNRKLRFDFYLTEHNICIEYDGEQHFKEVKIFKQNRLGLKDNKIRDEIKNKWCRENNIKLIRISYKENVENKLKEALPTTIM